MSKRVVRGGGWGDLPRNLRSTYRNRDFADEANDDQGFRLIQEDAKGASLVVCGGSWRGSNPCRPTYRGRSYPDDNQDMCLSFRLVQEVRND